MSFLPSKEGLGKLKRAKKGSSTVIGVISALAIVVIFLVVIVQIMSSFLDNIDRTTISAEGNTTLTSIENANWSALKMAAVIPLVLVGAGVLKILIGSFGGDK